MEYLRPSRVEWASWISLSMRGIGERQYLKRMNQNGTNIRLTADK